MPIYTYVCKDCRMKFDLLVGVTSEKTEFKCKKCGSKHIEKTFSSFSVQCPNQASGSSGPGCPAGTCPLG